METNVSLTQIPDWLKGNWNLKSGSDSEPDLAVGENTIQIKCQQKGENWSVLVNLEIPEGFVGPITELVREKVQYTVTDQTKGEKKLEVEFLLVNPNEIAPRFVADPWLLIDFGHMIKS